MKFSKGDLLVIQDEESFYDDGFVVVKDIQSDIIGHERYRIFELNERIHFGVDENKLRELMNSEIEEAKRYFKNEIESEFNFIKSAFDKIESKGDKGDL